ncbi:MAG TPA: O-antigen ligase family protein [Burkholderiales bacterium]|nr:O-antigen ligase family protein [Burkholderiales bacterium]
MRLLDASAWTAALFLASSLLSHDVALRLVLLGVATLLCAGVLARERGAVSALPSIWWAWLLFAVWAAASIGWSLEPARSQKEWQNEVFYTTLALLVCHVGAQAQHAARAFIVALATGGALACLSALWAFASGLPPESDAGWHGAAGNHSAALLTLMPCALAALWYARQARWPRLALWAGALLIVLFLASAFATQNRTVWLGFALEVAVFVVLLALRRAGDRRAQLSIALAGAVVVAATVPVVLLVQAEREITGAFSIRADPRFSIWPKAMQHIEQRPLAGYGFGRGLLRDRLPGEANQELAWHAHNLFLDVTLQTGLIGLVLFVVLLAAVLRHGLRFAADANAVSAASGMALIAVLVGMLTRNMTDMLLVRQNSLLFWGLTGVLLAWGARGRGA